MANLIIGLVGPRGAGKGEAAAFLARECGAAVHAYGDICREIATALALEHSRANLVRVGQVLVEHFAHDVLSRAMFARVAHAIAPLVVVEGFRYPQDVETLQALKGFRLYSIEAPAETRWMRCLDRAEKPDEKRMTFAEFQAWERAATERHIPSLTRLADRHIANDNSIAQLHGILRIVLAEDGWRAPIPG